MSTLNHAQDIPTIYQTVEKNIQQQEEKVRVMMRLREGIFKTFAIVGYPRVINSLQALQAAAPSEVLAQLPAKPIRSESSWHDITEQRERGNQLFDAIYERHTQRVREHMYNAYPDLAQTAINHLYGPILSEPSIVSAKETSLIMIAGLMVQDVPAQLKGHRYGALHLGATQQDLSRVENLVDLLSRYYKQQEQR
ncbi:AhpD-like protein [Zychaea mexicana]|uniref:AhpD-like protein n=1 Tax=Zychaea mexicana TaxID=64656 RepID=UPI0022FDDC67|nr:AhpD-like protein [Zychaea mexicana]KAI9495557.1 AhpD-like protein [Zychaea mexicana]